MYENYSVQEVEPDGKSHDILNNTGWLPVDEDVLTQTQSTFRMWVSRQQDSNNGYDYSIPSLFDCLLSFLPSFLLSTFFTSFFFLSLHFSFSFFLFSLIYIVSIYTFFLCLIFSYQHVQSVSDQKDTVDASSDDNDDDVTADHIHHLADLLPTNGM